MKHFSALIRRWYREVVDRYAFVHVFIGIHYQFGIGGVAKNEVKAVKWIRKAAEQGFAPAQLGLGNFYDEGIGVEKDEVEAVKWYRKAAEQGDAAAQFAQMELGQCYGEGIGVEKDEAYAYFNLAVITVESASQKRDAMDNVMSESARQTRDAMDNVMSSTQRAEGQRRTKELQAQIAKSKS